MPSIQNNNVFTEIDTFVAAESMSAPEMSPFDWMRSCDVMNELCILVLTVLVGFTLLNGSKPKLQKGKQFVSPKQKQRSRSPSPTGVPKTGSKSAVVARETSINSTKAVTRLKETCEASPVMQPLQQKSLPKLPEVQQEQRLPALEGVAKLIDDIMQRSIASRLNPEDVLQIYAKMKADGKLNDAGSWTSKELGRHTALEFFSTVLKFAALQSKPALCIQILDEMLKAGISTSAELYDNTIRIFGGRKHLKGAIALYDHMEANGVEGSATMLSCLTSFAADLAEWSRMDDFFKKLCARETPSVRAYMIVLRAYSKRGDWFQTKEVFADMQSRGVAMDNLMLNLILGTAVALNEVKDAEVVFEEALRSSPGLGDVVTCNTMLKGYAKIKDVSSALRMLDRMQDLHLQPNAITFNTVMDVLVRSSRCHEAWAMLDKMQREGVCTDRFTVSILVKGFYEARNNTTIKQVYTALDMTSQVQCDMPLLGNLYRGIIEAAARLRDVQLLKRVFTQMKQQSVDAAIVEQPGPVGPTRKERGLQGRNFRTGPMLRHTLHLCAEMGHLEDGVELLRAALAVGVVPPADGVDHLSQAALAAYHAGTCYAYTTLFEIAENHGLDLSKHSHSTPSWKTSVSSPPGL
eukprot:gnl/TRDRNA2_/TRDRNA2_66841_c0_seq1.p1 gnl/TRDRNA2_/TRDRNA2_66841_c0~~gnl/TRDRNA2_/TRDRNA2_66841_c0_seq1.p1  ORF type:complete len:663 (-),score=152.07 gnl/TRDRNA2_/TRDRNA2_66841_c0_seq1:157-2058(-)